MSAITLCSISPEAFSIPRAYLHRIEIPAAPQGGYSSIVINDAKDAKVFWQSLTEKEVVPIDIPASDIVRDILQSEELEDKGVFAITDGRSVPTDKELMTARERRQKLMSKWVMEGDRLFGQWGPRAIERIPDCYKRAGQELGVERDWIFVRVKANFECEGCGSAVKFLKNGSKPAICPNCKGILDPEKALAMGLAEPVPVEQKRGPGRPRKQVEEVTA